MSKLKFHTELIASAKNMLNEEYGKTRLTEENIAKLKNDFSEFLFIEVLIEYLTTITGNHTVKRIEKKIEDFNICYHLKECLDRRNHKELINLNALVEDIKSNMGIKIDDRKLSTHLRKDLGLVQYRKDYITKEEFRKILLEEHMNTTGQPKYNSSLLNMKNLI